MYFYDDQFFISIYLSLIAILLYFAIVFKSKYSRLEYYIPKPPSPLALPIIGHIYLLAKYHLNPWEGFNKIKENYGDVVQLKLGQCKAVLVSSTDAIREVLLTKADIFADRPHVYRHTLIFGRDRENSLALCDWSDRHKSRRGLAQIGVIPRYGSRQYKSLDYCIQNQIKHVLADLENQNNFPFIIDKNFILTLCSDVFCNYLCSKKFSKDDEEYKLIVYYFDYVFYDINQSYAVDFIPFLYYSGIYSTQFNYLEQAAIKLRSWVEDVIVKPRLEEIVHHFKDNKDLDTETLFEDRDFLDTILKYFLKNSNEMPWSICLFEIGDLIGGQSAVGNLLMRLLGHVAANQHVQNDLHEEVKNVINETMSDFISLEHRLNMPLHEASILETLRIASSPIVPHVATQNTTIQGYEVEKGTMVLFNVYYLNFSTKYWHDPYKFNPSRFLTNTKGKVHVTKPDNFLPFSSGKRACLGYKMVTSISFCVLANLLFKYKIVPENDVGCQDIDRHLAPKGCLALSPDTCFKVALIPRS